MDELVSKMAAVSVDDGDANVMFEDDAERYLVAVAGLCGDEGAASVEAANRMNKFLPREIVSSILDRCAMKRPSSYRTPIIIFYYEILLEKTKYAITISYVATLECEREDGCVGNWNSYRVSKSGFTVDTYAAVRD